MIRLELSPSDWQTSKGYWNELKQHFSKPEDTNKVQFIDRVLFESSSLNDANSTAPSIISIPSINSMSQMMSEIDSEVKNNGNEIDIDVKTQDLEQTTVTIETATATTTKENSQQNKELNQFIGAAVMCFS